MSLSIFEPNSLSDPSQMTILASWMSDLPWSSAPDLAAEVVRHIQQLLQAQVGRAGADALLSAVVMQIEHTPARLALQDHLIASAPVAEDLTFDDRYAIAV